MKNNMKKDKLIEFLDSEISKLKDSLKENSMENCDDDEMPNFEKRSEDLAKIDAYKNVLKFIKNGRE
jgi:hypothetical protein